MSRICRTELRELLIEYHLIGTLPMNLLAPELTHFDSSLPAIGNIYLFRQLIEGRPDISFVNCSAHQVTNMGHLSTIQQSTDFF